jgi:VWFA-related protein
MRVLAAICAFSCMVHAQAQWQPDEVRSTNHIYEPPSPVTLRVQSSLVEVGVVVRDAGGRVVGGLQRSSFRIFDDGKERAVTAFSVETSSARTATAKNTPASPAPNPAQPGAAGRSVILFFDDLNTAAGDLARTRLPARRFVAEALDPGDRVAIATSSSAPVLDFMTDRPKILDAIARVASHQRVSENGISQCPRITPYQAYLIVSHDTIAEKAAIDEQYVCDNGPPAPASLPVTALNQLKAQVDSQAEATWTQARISAQDTLAAIAAAVDRLSKTQGTRMLVLASSGFLATTLDAKQDRIVDRALRANVVIHSLDAKGLYSETPRSGGAQGGDLPLSTFVFEQTTAGGRRLETGAAMSNLAESTGGLFLHNNNDLDAGLRSLVPETTYRLGFAPDVIDDGKYHSLKVRLVAGESNHVLARRGYFAPAAAKPPDPARKIDIEAAASDTLADLPARMVADPGQDRLRVTLIVDVRALKFDRVDVRRVQTLSFIAALFREDGDFVCGKEGELKLALQEATFTHFIETGISTQVSLQAPPGSYRLRGVVQDSAGKMTASTLAVVIY